jgi:hypothetical protein
MGGHYSFGVLWYAPRLRFLPQSNKHLSSNKLLKTTNPYLAQVNILLLSGYQFREEAFHEKHYRRYITTSS